MQGLLSIFLVWVLLARINQQPTHTLHHAGGMDGWMDGWMIGELKTLFHWIPVPHWLT
jgi:hypothetical protein